MASDVRGRRSQGQRVAESSERLLTAAIELIAEQGFERTTAAAIGKRAGYSHGLVHVRFGSKEALLESILRAYEAAMLPPAPEGLSGLDQVLHQLDSANQRGQAEPAFFRAFCVLCFETVGAAAPLRSWVVDWFGRYVEQTAERLKAGQRDGSVRRDLDAFAEAQWLLDAGTGMAFRWLVNDGAVGIDVELQRLRELLIERVAPSPARARP
jgi:AcrR family transcriptional regulator